MNLRRLIGHLLLGRVARSAASEPRDVYNNAPDAQELDIYWDENFADILETWGDGNVWAEIEYLVVNCRGRVLDVACGTGKVMQQLARFKALELYGCDISEVLIKRAIGRGISAERLLKCDATQIEYPGGWFDHAYSIGSLEHFTEDGIVKCVSECNRIVKKTSFHNVPVSKDGVNHGWIRRHQSYFNNSQEWWLDKFKTTFSEVDVLSSSWQDDISVGKWFVCR